MPEVNFMIIFLLSLFKLLAFIFSTVCLFFLKDSLKKDPNNEALSSFYRAFLFLAIDFSLFLMMPLVNAFYVQILFALDSFMVSLCMAYLVRTLLLFTYFKEFRIAASQLIILSAMGELWLWIKNLQPAFVFTYHFAGFDFVGWYPNLSPKLLLLKGLITISVAGVSSIFFFIKAFRSEETFIKKRSFLLGVGILFMGVAGIAKYLFGSLIPLTFWKDLFHGISIVVGVIFLFAGISIKNPVAKTDIQAKILERKLRNLTILI